MAHTLSAGSWPYIAPHLLSYMWVQAMVGQNQLPRRPHASHAELEQRQNLQHLTRQKNPDTIRICPLVIPWVTLKISRYVQKEIKEGFRNHRLLSKTQA